MQYNQPRPGDLVGNSGLQRLKVKLSNPFKKFDNELPGVLRGVAGDEVSIEVIGAAYDNAGSITSAVSVNALLSP